MGTEPVGKLPVKLAIPAVTAQLINVLCNAENLPASADRMPDLFDSFPGGRHALAQDIRRVFTPNQEPLDFTAKAMRIYFGGVVIFGIQMSCRMTFVSIGYAG